MRRLIYGLNFSPELAEIGKYTGEMVPWLAEREHEIKVITAPPYYPRWQLQEGYSSWWYRREAIKGVRAYRCPLWVPRRLSVLKRLLHLASIAASRLPMLLWHGLRLRPDVVLVVEPISFCIPGVWMVARIGGLAVCSGF